VVTRVPPYWRMRHSTLLLRVGFLAAAAVPGVPLPAAAQDAWDPTEIHATRGGLDSLARRLELAAESPAYSVVLRAQAAQEAAAVRDRLREGDFRIGDRIALSVEREATYSDSFTVEEGPAIRLPSIGEIGLAGVLRSELEGHLVRELSVYLRDPVLRARTSIRIAVLGAVGRPGFHAMPTQLLVTDVLAQAGQTSGNADIGKIRIERDGRVIWDNEALAPEIIIGRTLDELGVRAGDRIIVGSRSSFIASLQRSSGLFYMFIGLPPVIISLVALIT